jgi:pyruvate dehydrogenase E1 component beta subunit
MPIITYREALRQALIHEMDRDESVYVIGEEVALYQGTFRVTEGLLARYGPRRVIDTPISEAGFSGVGIGSAIVGLRPVVEFMTMNFAIMALDQLLNHAAKYHYMSGGQLRVPIVFRGPSGPGRGLAAQHSQSLEAWYAHTPGCKVVLPATPADAKGLLISAIRDENPVFVLEHAGLYTLRGEVPDGEYVVPLGTASVMRPGEDVTIVSYSRMAQTCLRAAEKLAEEGISAEVIDLRSLRPLDIETVASSVRKTNHAVVAHEAWRFCGAGAEIAAEIYEQAIDYLDAPVERVAGEDVPMPYAQNLERLAVPDINRVVAAAKRTLWRADKTAAHGEGGSQHGPVGDAENGRHHGGGHNSAVAQEARRSG